MKKKKLTKIDRLFADVLAEIRFKLREIDQKIEHLIRNYRRSGDCES